MQDQPASEENLSREELQALKNKRSGMAIFQLSWMMAFVAMVIINWQLRFSPLWLEADTETANPLLGTVATVVLLISALLVHRAQIAIQADNRSQFLSQWAAAIALGAGFVAIMLYEWSALTPGTQYVQVFRLMTGFHVFHAGAIGLYLVRVYRNGRAGQYGPAEYWAVEAGAKLWYFVLVAWILFYMVIYWL